MTNATVITIEFSAALEDTAIDLLEEQPYAVTVEPEFVTTDDPEFIQINLSVFMEDEYSSNEVKQLRALLPKVKEWFDSAIKQC